MSLDIFFDQFAQLADEPNGVRKLRELILQLAVQGKLVPQDPNDEPASLLLDKIRAEKARVNGQRKLLDEEAPDLDEVPYELPESWVWVQLAEVGHDWGQKRPDVEFTYIDVSAINKEKGIISEDVNIIQPADAPSRARKLVKQGTVI